MGDGVGCKLLQPVKRAFDDRDNVCNADEKNARLVLVKFGFPCLIPLLARRAGFCCFHQIGQAGKQRGQRHRRMVYLGDIFSSFRRGNVEPLNGDVKYLVVVGRGFYAVNNDG